MCGARQGVTTDTEGLSFESSPLQSTYARALTFIKAWELHAAEGLSSLTTKDVALEVPLRDLKASGQPALLSYREGLGTLGMLTVDSIRATPSRFTANLHEYGIDKGQNGLPMMHAELKLDFTQARDGSVLISRVFFNIEYLRKVRRASTFAMPNEEVTLAAEL